MTSSRRLDIQPFKDFLTGLITNYVTNPQPGAPVFSLFTSTEYVVPGQDYVQRNLMFSDFTQTLTFPAEEEITTFYKWIG